MKRFLFTILLVACASFVYAQRPSRDVIHLKNGSIIKGTIIPANDGIIKIQTQDGSVFVYKTEDVEIYAKEEITKTPRTKKILDLPKQSFGIRGGFSYSLICSPLDFYGYSFFDQDIRHGVGGHIGGSYEVAVNKTNRWYFQTGLDLRYVSILDGNERTFTNYEGMDNYEMRCQFYNGNLLSIDIPMMFACKCKIGNNVWVCPGIGVSHTFGIWGNTTGYTYKVYNSYGNPVSEGGYWEHPIFFEYEYSDTREVYEPNYYPCSRYYFNLKGELNISFNKYVLGVNAAIALCNGSGGFVLFGEPYICNVGLTFGYRF